ncbi:hypothetical protein B0H63DRAFT_141938 [Podospora didyma]|uniref:Uncharacterized protein n=1 Tax=Podospora didyma TaxID=330526 RepID=A0AAE0NSK0_9PEZI|nr:hypothetical protein B0H63DRAFT_141938 [Podospora didyma]
MAEESLAANATGHYDPKWGWVESGRDRGTLDLLWSCCVTIILCAWVATHPNAGSPKDKWFHAVLDKTSLAMIGLLGPDFLFGIAFGQFSSARRSVKKFRTEKVPCNGATWTLTYAFFADMGGMLLTSPDFPDGFPVDANQLHYLLKHEHINFPDMKEMNIHERNTSDKLSRLITVWQALWFSVTEIVRIRNGLPMSTLELTALSYVFVMLATQVCWWKKPSIVQPRFICTKDNKPVSEIRAYAKQETHPDLPSDPDDWYRTPLDFLNGPRFQIGTHWSYYIRLTHLLNLGALASRPMKRRPWDRFPSDTWLPCERSWYIATPAAFVLLAFSMWFALGWNFYFPTTIERDLWHAFSIYHAVFGLYGGVYYLIEMLKWHREQNKSRERLGASRQVSSSSMTGSASSSTAVMVHQEVVITVKESTTTTTTTTTTKPTIHAAISINNADAESQTVIAPKRWRHLLPRHLVDLVDKAISILCRLDAFVEPARNISRDQDPEMRLPLKVIIPVTVTCYLYVVCRTYFWVEDFLSLRVQPTGVYITVNRYMPFWGDG